VDEPFRLVGAGITTYRVGERFIGVRSTDPALDARLRALIPSHVVRGVDAPPNLSLKLGVDDGPVRDFHFLLRGTSPAVRTASRGRLLRATLAQLDGFADLPPGTVRLNARLLVRDGEAVLVDLVLGSQLDRVERRLERLGYQFADHHGAVLDRTTLEAVVWAPRLQIDVDALAALALDHPTGPGELSLTASLIPVARVVACASVHDDEDDHSPARALVDLAPLVTTPDGRLDTDHLELLGRLAEQGLVTRIAQVEDPELIELLRARP